MPRGTTKKREAGVEALQKTTPKQGRRTTRSTSHGDGGTISNKMQIEEARPETPVPKEVSQALKRATRKAVATFKENEENVTMEVDINAPENEFNSEEEDEQQSEVTFKVSKIRNKRMNSPEKEMESDGEFTDSEGDVQSSDEGEILSDEDDYQRKNGKGKMTDQGSSKKIQSCNSASLKEDEKEGIINAAVAKFQDVFMKSGIVETANLLKKQLNKNV